jgi:glutathione S-transferase
MAQPGPPLLWHIKVSHYSEKVRWALDHKGVDHVRRAPVPGSHMLFALWLTRGGCKTFPVLELDGERIGDSTRIIEALERRCPDPPLYPADPAERARALELEEFFDEEFAPYVRRFVWHESTKDPEAFGDFAVAQVPAPLDRWRWPARTFATTFVKLRYGAASDEGAEIARRKIVAGVDRLDAELGSGDYLVGDTFTVADLAAASLMYPLVRPPEGPELAFEPPPPLREFFSSLADRRGCEWTTEMFRRHRRGAAVGAPA